MATGHTDDRIRKLFARGLTFQQIARKIGRPGDVERVLRALREGDVDGFRFRCNRCARPMVAISAGAWGCSNGACECGGLIEADPRNFEPERQVAALARRAEIDEERVDGREGT